MRKGVLQLAEISRFVWSLIMLYGVRLDADCSPESFTVLRGNAKSLYRTCRTTSEVFQEVNGDVASLMAVLEQAQETYEEINLSKEQRGRLGVILQSSGQVLADLKSMITRYDASGLQTKRRWETLEWGEAERSEMRSRLTAQVTLLTSFENTLRNMDRAKVERLILQYLEEVESGRRAESILSSNTVESLEMDEKQAWRTIRHELTDAGITLQIFNDNQGLIISILKRELLDTDLQSRNHLFQEISETEESDDAWGRPDTATRSSQEQSHEGGVVIPEPQLSSGSEERSHDQQEPVTTNYAFPLYAAVKNLPANSISRVANFKSSRLLKAISTITVSPKEICTAAATNDYMRVRSIVERNRASVNAKFGGHPVLAHAILRSRWEIVDFLLSRGADPLTAIRTPATYPSTKVTIRAEEVSLLHTVLIQQSYLVRLIVELADISDVDRAYWCLCELCCFERWDTTDFVRILLERGVSCYDLTKPYTSPSLSATRIRNESTMRLLLEAGADPFVSVFDRHSYVGRDSPTLPIPRYCSDSINGNELHLLLSASKGADPQIRSRVPGSRIAELLSINYTGQGKYLDTSTIGTGALMGLLDYAAEMDTVLWGVPMQRLRDAGLLRTLHDAAIFAFGSSNHAPTFLKKASAIYTSCPLLHFLVSNEQASLYKPLVDSRLLSLDKVDLARRPVHEVAATDQQRRILAEVAAQLRSNPSADFRIDWQGL